ncbi:rhamnogalacturonyl hydrolase YesR [Caulobacter sp. BE264]|uniref:glycoside hydrolase family 88/105 protein n=1 Tax=Caulobacter sp. BE264 TaxID=2817724 RepID=UPI002857FAD9|nr:glycoside hydrolase family 88 protein [Caulobacter sp. BE264]MDR7230085.1 rhamnogalacturonyl hydrolase YesR [Caulobacter sp. BE264]
MTFKFLTAALVAAWVAGAGAQASAAPQAGPARVSAASVDTAARKVAAWQLAHMDNFDYVPVTSFRKDTEAPRDWVQAAFYIGLSTYAGATQDPYLTRAVLAHGEAQQWSFDHRPRHADADAIGAVWIWAANRTNDPSKLDPIKSRFAAVLANPSTVSLDFEPKPAKGDPYCQARWCWSDAIFMAPPAWTALAKTTGDKRYLAHADREFWATHDYLFDKTDHLYFRDSRFIARRDAEGRKIFWGRGNGWAFAGIARILQDLPANHPSRPRYEAVFRQMAAKIASLQGEQGYWPVSLLEPQKTPETSGTGFFVYGLAWGVNHGVLPRAKYASVIDKGWKALEAAVEPDGRLGWVQRVGVAPDQVGRDDTQLYGVGAFLLAASEVRRLAPAYKGQASR